MKNIFFIDGPQMSGKTTLIEFLEKSTNGLVYKFDFSEFFKNVGVGSHPVGSSPSFFLLILNQ